MAEYVPKTVKDVPSHQFVVHYAAHLKAADKLQLPAWADLVKTGTFKELGPLDPDWYYTRAASIARLVYLRQDVGVGALRKRYGGAKGRGVRTYHHAKAAGGLIRHILKQLDDIGIVEKSDNTKGGRRITPQGQRDLDLIAGRVEIPTTATA